MTTPTAHTIRPERVVIVPGFGATPANHWFGPLAAACSERGTPAEIVDLPTPGDPQRAEWERTLAGVLGTPAPSTWIVAHSLGCITALRVLAALPEPWQAGGLILVAGFSGPLAHNASLDAFLAEEAPTQAAASHVARRVVFASDDDPSVPLERSRELASRLLADFIVLPGRGHFRARDGVADLPEAVDVMFPAAG